MKKTMISFISLLILTLSAGPATPWSASGSRGGLLRRAGTVPGAPAVPTEAPLPAATDGGSGSWSATGARAGTASGSHYGTSGSWSAHGAYGGSASGGHYYGGTYPAYHPPTTVNVYGSGCYNCGGWHAAGAVAAGMAVGMATGAAIASANTAAATTSAYQAGVAAGLKKKKKKKMPPVRATRWARSRPPCRPACATPQSQREDVLSMRQYLVPAELRRQRGILPGGADALSW